MSEKEINLKVFIRVRPPLTKEERSRTPDVEIDDDSQHIQIFSEQEGEDAKVFRFDHVFGPESRQDEVFDTLRAPEMIARLWKGFSTTVFAYGMTGSGKTYTVMGKEGKLSKSTRECWGLLPRVLQYLFDSIESMKCEEPDSKHKLSLSFIEIYNEQVRDLLRDPQDKPTDLKILGDKVAGAKQPYVKKFNDINALFRRGLANRQTESTKANAVSSRSHSIFSVFLEYSFVTKEGLSQTVNGSIQFVDLAGMETLKIAGDDGVLRSGPHNSPGNHIEKARELDRNRIIRKQRQFREMTKINNSLSCLMQVIDQLSDEQKLAEIKAGKLRIRYRDSKLTHLLKSSLDPMAQTHTYMIANINPFHRNFATKTIKYANSAKNMKTQPTANKATSKYIRKQMEKRTEDLHKLIEKLKGMGINCGDSLDGLDSVVAGLQDEKTSLKNEVDKVAVALEMADHTVKYLSKQLAGKGILENLMVSLPRIAEENLRHLIELEDTVAEKKKKKSSHEAYVKHYVALLRAAVAGTAPNPPLPWDSVEWLHRILDLLLSATVDLNKAQAALNPVLTQRMAIIESEHERLSSEVHRLARGPASEVSAQETQEWEVDHQNALRDLEAFDLALTTAAMDTGAAATVVPISHPGAQIDSRLPDSDNEAFEADQEEEDPIERRMTIELSPADCGGLGLLSANRVAACRDTQAGKILEKERFDGLKQLLENPDVDAVELLRILENVNALRTECFSKLQEQAQLTAEKNKLLSDKLKKQVKRTKKLEEMLKMNQGEFGGQITALQKEIDDREEEVRNNISKMAERDEAIRDRDAIIIEQNDKAASMSELLAAKEESISAKDAEIELLRTMVAKLQGDVLDLQRVHDRSKDDLESFIDLTHTQSEEIETLHSSLREEEKKFEEISIALSREKQVRQFAECREIARDGLSVLKQHRKKPTKMAMRDIWVTGDMKRLAWGGIDGARPVTPKKSLLFESVTKYEPIVRENEWQLRFTDSQGVVLCFKLDNSKDFEAWDRTMRRIIAQTPNGVNALPEEEPPLPEEEEDNPSLPDDESDASDILTPRSYGDILSPINDSDPPLPAEDEEAPPLPPE